MTAHHLPLTPVPRHHTARGNHGEGRQECVSKYFCFCLGIGIVRKCIFSKLSREKSCVNICNEAKSQTRGDKRCRATFRVSGICDPSKGSFWNSKLLHGWRFCLSAPSRLIGSFFVTYNCYDLVFAVCFINFMLCNFGGETRQDTGHHKHCNKITPKSYLECTQHPVIIALLSWKWVKLFERKA